MSEKVRIENGAEKAMPDEETPMDSPAGGWEYNLKNDVCAANVLFKSDMNVWQIPRNVYRMMPVTFAELYDRVRPYGGTGKYLAENVVAFNNAWE